MMRRLITISMGFLLFAANLDLTMHAQETAGSSSRKLVSRGSPVYPELARIRNLEGTVKLKIKVAPDGTVKSVQAVGGSPIFLKPAEDAVYKFRWSSAQGESEELVELKFQIK